MKRRTAMPFLTLVADSVEATGWFNNSAEDGPEPLGDHVRNWEYGRDLIFGRRLTIDWRKAAEALELKNKFDLELVVRAGTGQGTLARQENCRRSLLLEWGTPEASLDIEMSGTELSDQVILATDILLASSGVQGAPLSPRNRGERLWSDRRIVRLEGDESRFPMEVVSFNSLFPNRVEAGALWYLHWAPNELDRDFHGAIRLYLNADFPEFVERMQAQDEMTLQMVLTDVVSQMCEHYLLNRDQSDPDETFEPGAVGIQIQKWLNLAFGNVGIAQMRSTLELRPGHFRAALQSAMKL